MEISVSVVQGDPEPLRTKFDDAGLAYEIEERRNFDGFIPILSFIFDTVGNFSSLVLPFVIYFLEKNPGSQVEINGVKISGLSAEQIRELVLDLDSQAQGRRDATP